jgi:Xaa-Pro aminopeptidase
MPSVAKSSRIQIFVAFAALLLAAPELSAQDDASFRKPPAPYAFVHPTAKPSELRRRRERLAEILKDGTAILVSDEPASLYSGARYRPGNNIFYFTGVESDFCALVLTAKDGAIASETLFLPAYDAHYELWNGKRAVASPEAAKASGVETIVETSASAFGDRYAAFEDAIDLLYKGGERTFFLEGEPKSRRPQTKKLRLSGRDRHAHLREFVSELGDDVGVRSLSAAATKLRSIKSEHEIALIREAVRVTGVAFDRSVRLLRPGMWEFEFEASMQGTFIELGCTGLPYYPIAASGPNSCILHYNESRRRMEEGDVLLADIGAEWGWYAADITRTYPVSGKFTPRQRAVYEAVLAGQTAAATILRPGVTWAVLQEECRRAMLAAGLEDKELHPHGLGHPVGLDVHDAGDSVMKPGMLITIEPGSYLKDEGFGVRIEDVYLVTENGAECVSKGIPKAVDEIEALVGAAFKRR